jgi:proteasome accessory factor A
MTTHILGTETEFGVAAKGGEALDPVSNAIFLINSYPTAQPSPVLWDYENENPLLDARGFQVEGERERPSQEYNRMLNQPLHNGGRLYVDGAHPEYSTPECTNARAVVAHEKAGERIMEAALLAANRRKREVGSEFSVYKNNADGKGNSYGYHENYLVSRTVLFETLVSQMTPFFVTRQIVAGAGKVGAENQTQPVDYQMAQRSDFFETLVDLNTMVKRPIINTRDEPHCDITRWRRFHVIVGDVNMAEMSTYLKVGTTAMVLAMLEQGHEVKGVEIENPVRAIKEVSRDLTLKKTLRLTSGADWRATEVQYAYLEAAERCFENDPDPVRRDLLKQWRRVLDALADDPMRLSRELDWVIKKQLIESFIQRKNCNWKDARVLMMGLQYHDIDQTKGLYYTLERGGHVARMIDDEAIALARENPPTDSRAYFRGACLKKFPKEVYAASWTSVLFDVGDRAIKRVPMMDPHKGTEQGVGALLEGSKTVESLLAQLGHS